VNWFKSRGLRFTSNCNNGERYTAYIREKRTDRKVKDFQVKMTSLYDRLDRIGCSINTSCLAERRIQHPTSHSWSCCAVSLYGCGSNITSHVRHSASVQCVHLVDSFPHISVQCLKHVGYIWTSTKGYEINLVCELFRSYTRLYDMFMHTGRPIFSP
jgi:hypothetical protein